MAEDSSTYDICIIGAGIAGLYVATEMIRQRPKCRICIADKYKFLGGRVTTYRVDISGVKYQWEEGAARISESHTLMLNLFRQYKLTTAPIRDPTLYRESAAYPLEPALFNESIPITLEPLRELDIDVLETNTIESLFKRIMGPKEAAALCIRHPYRAEINVLRADMGLTLFQNEFAPSEKYVVCKEGLGELITRMVAEFEQRGGTILRQHEMVEISGNSSSTEKAIFKKGPPSEGESRPDLEIGAKHFVFALPSVALSRIPQFVKWPLLKRIAMKPLFRVYAAFPLNSKGKAWFEGMPKIVTATAPRYIIPVDLKTGSLQISYTDSEDAEPLMEILEKSGEEGLGKKIMEDLRLLFHDSYKIPDPLFVKAFPWKEGTSYWLPGHYNPYEESRRAIQPFRSEHPNWYVCGESYSSRQCWMEGAVEHAKLAVAKLLGRV